MPRVAALLVRTIRPYALHLSLLAYTPLLLFADGATEGVEPQIALGLLTFAVLWAASRRVEPARRWEGWLCVPVATLFEVFGSLVWGGYTYELRNIPLYVPPGHALVYVFGITAGTLPVMRRHGRTLRGLVMVVASGWVLAGLTVLPFLTGRLDVQGAIVWPLLAWCVLAVEEGRHVRRHLGGGRHDRDRGNVGGRLGLGRVRSVVASAIGQPAVRDRGRLRGHRRLGRPARAPGAFRCASRSVSELRGTSTHRSRPRASVGIGGRGSSTRP